MAVLTPLKAITLTATEQQTVQAATGYEDAVGMLSAITAEIAEINVQLGRLASYLPAGTNLTSINTIISTLS